MYYTKIKVYGVNHLILYNIIIYILYIYISFFTLIDAAGASIEYTYTKKWQALCIAIYNINDIYIYIVADDARLTKPSP